MTQDSESQAGPDEPSRAEAVAPVIVEDEGDRLSLLDLVAVLLRQRRWLVAVPAFMVLLLVGHGFVTSTEYSADSSFTPQATGESLAQLRGIAAQFGVRVGGGGEDRSQSPEFYAELLKSRDVLRRAVDYVYQFEVRAGDDTIQKQGDLVALYGIEEGTRKQRVRAAAGRLKNSIDVTTGRQTGMVTVTTRALWPELAEQINQRLLELVHAFNNESRQSQAAAERRFIGERLKEAREELRAAEDSLKNFLLRNRGLGDSPELRFERQRLERRVDLRQQVFTSLAESYEQSRINEVKNTPLITIVQSPEDSARPVKRGLVMSVFLGLVIGGMLAVPFVLAKEYLERAREDGEEDYREFDQLWDATKEDLLRPLRVVRRRLSV